MTCMAKNNSSKRGVVFFVANLSPAAETANERRTKQRTNCESFVGIPFVTTNYFCGDKPIYAALNAVRSTASTTSGVCLA